VLERVNAIVSHDEAGFAEFFRASWDPCLRAVAASIGDLRRARERPLSERDVGAPAWPATGLDSAALAAVQRLPARQREVHVLRVFLDLDIETTAAQLAIAPGTVRAHLSRAITALRNELAHTDTPEAAPCSTTTR
jgi:DNA-directed RNA polymerase specialized sigma24 family protein